MKRKANTQEGVIINGPTRWNTAMYNHGQLKRTNHGDLPQEGKGGGFMSSRQNHTPHGRMQPSLQSTNSRKVLDGKQLVRRAQRNYGTMPWNWNLMSIPTLQFPIPSWWPGTLTFNTSLSWDGTIGSSSLKPLPVVDSNHAGDRLQRRSRTGFYIFLNSALIAWVSK